MQRKTRIILQGFGFMGQVHARCYAANSDAEVVGIIDLEVERTKKVLLDLGLALVPVASNLATLMEKVAADVLDICLPTDTHPDAAEAGFSAHLHIFCEKPIALDITSAQRITAAATRSGKQLMIGHCLRFWPEYVELKKMIKSGEAGRLLALTLFRRSPRPGYTVGNWISDPKRCLGAVLDLHIHDTDLVHYLLGKPKGVYSRGIQLTTGWDHIQTQYIFDRLAVQAEGGWNYPESRPFQMGYCALFEKGSIDYDSTATPPLRRNIEGKVWTNRSIETPEIHKDLEGLDGYQNQLDYFVEKISQEQKIEINTGEQATESLQTLLAEIHSADSGKIVHLKSNR